MNAIQKLSQVGQSVWCDNLSRKLIASGELQRLVDMGITGVTSNPTIFMKAIAGSNDYDKLLQKCLAEGVEDVVALYERLVIPDVADAADILRPVYDHTKGVDGYVSLEVNPKLAYDTKGTVAEARRLFAELDRPNVLIKVPATEDGIPAVETLIAEGINVNATLIFSVAVYRQVMQAYVAGLRRLDGRGGEVRKVASVASFFVSRVDTAVDKLLEQKRGSVAGVESLAGKAANANADIAYARFLEVFSPRGEWKSLADRGAKVQRPLWASTSTKNPAYSDTIYVDPLIGPNTVNTMPPQTIEAAMDHGATEVALGKNLDASKKVLARLAEIGIDLTSVTDQLTVDGVKLFAQSFDELLANLSKKRDQLKVGAR